MIFTTQRSAPLSTDVPPPPWPEATRRAWRNFAYATAGLALAFSLPLADLAQTAWKSDLFSYVLLVPLITAYLVWSRRHLLETAAPRRSVGLALLPISLGLILVVAQFAGFTPGEDLWITTLAFELFVVGAALVCLGGDTVRRLAGPIAFAIFMVPPPEAMVAAVETGLQHGSAWAVAPLFRLWGTPVLQEGLQLTLPGEFGPLRLMVARECSGINSTVVLFVVSVAGGLLLLRSPWSRAVLIAAIVPIAIIRNAFRIFVIGQLSIDIGPHILHSWLHKQGGPIFFALSLVPVAALLLLLLHFPRPARSPLRSTSA